MIHYKEKNKNKRKSKAGLSSEALLFTHNNKPHTVCVYIGSHLTAKVCSGSTLTV